ncbi:hypothetical protein O7627_16335 [Solwaraspora sp. WMMD1047]|uniref:hypothetical protein n=1 Tax=Solwaraspora sp. WMMD1047 TaxID=3016102 RepID=UPI002415F061|nr:hypothetical protein [Solwaraspora sp. WMMD1047]MDG4830866.1 hypothetical protein [Solwaraspora sp. WMMD1047]
MDLRRMRRSCADLVRDLQPPDPTEPTQLITALCGRMGERLGVPVRHRLVRFPPETVSGLWIATDTANYLLCEQDTSGWHQLAITGHEFWHMEAEHQATAVPAGDVAGLGGDSPDRATVARVVAARAHCEAVAEQEAELFASLLVAKLSRWLPQRTWAVPENAVGVVDRLESTLGHPERRVLGPPGG